ncbi:alpha/beta-hydrolase family protein [Gordonia shandongensis]|uniref:alpha/beta-hydrolase family protein n=1 Tax=Gordonia shandongensis TaxID=376351 RepID=UPI0004156598|nr:alpha/beta-hydrolase family protein [Gordonia shandongensis]
MRHRPGRGTAVGALTGWLLSLSPGMLPRSAPVAAGVGTVLILVGAAIGAAGAAVLARRRREEDRYGDRPGVSGVPGVSGLAVTVGLIVAGAALGLSVRHEVAVRAALDAPGIGLRWVLVVALTPLSVAAAAFTVPIRVLTATGLIGTIVAAAMLMPGPADARAPDVPDRAIIDYGPLPAGSARTHPGLAERARTLVDDWERRGGITQRAVVVAVPTGSGWLDAATVDGIDRAFHGSVRVLALQYDDAPSWQSYLQSPDAAGASAVAVLRTVAARLRAVPERARPRVYLVGQSLGAIGADHARRWASEHRVAVAGTVLAGVPAGALHDAPSTTPRTVIANPDDPVTVFEPALLWRPAERSSWLPVVSFIGTAVDLLGSLNVPVGHGHRYGSLPDAAVPDTADPDKPVQPIGPRAAS